MAESDRPVGEGGRWDEWGEDRIGGVEFRFAPMPWNWRLRWHKDDLTPFWWVEVGPFAMLLSLNFLDRKPRSEPTAHVRTVGECLTMGGHDGSPCSFCGATRPRPPAIPRKKCCIGRWNGTSIVHRDDCPTLSGTAGGH
jgi:hypothetical protein